MKSTKLFASCAAVSVAFLLSACSTPAAEPTEAPSVDDDTLGTATAYSGGYSIAADYPYVWENDPWNWPGYYSAYASAYSPESGSYNRGVCLLYQYTYPSVPTCQGNGFINASGCSYCINGSCWEKAGSNACDGSPAMGGAATTENWFQTPTFANFSNGMGHWRFVSYACVGGPSNCDVSGVNEVY